MILREPHRKYGQELYMKRAFLGIFLGAHSCLVRKFANIIKV